MSTPSSQAAAPESAQPTEAPEATSTPPHVCSTQEHLKLEDLKELERFRLNIWISKAVITMMIATIILGFVYSVYVFTRTQTTPDVTLFGTIFGHLKEVLVVVIGNSNP